MRYLNPTNQSAAPSQANLPLRRAAQTRVQGDVVQFAETREEPIHSLVKGWHKSAEREIPLTRMANRSAKILAANVPQLFIPMNLNRVYFIVSNRTGAMIDLSFGYPAGPTAIGINNNNSFQQMGLVCATDDIYIVAAAAGALITCFEGVPSRSSLDKQK